MTREAIDAWSSLYAACMVCALVAAGIASGRVLYEVAVGRIRPETEEWRARLVFLPRLWLRWQLAYFSAMPVILLILSLFAAQLGLDVLLSV